MVENLRRNRIAYELEAYRDREKNKATYYKNG